MTISCGNDTQILRNRPQALGVDMARLATFFRKRYPTGTAAQVADDLGVSLRTVEGWLGSSPSAPRAAHLVTAIWVYGPEFLSVLLPETPGWLSEAARNAQREKALQDIAELQRMLDQ
ncbi:hypothetical protein AB1K42_15335 [Roseibium algicola]|uniref:hypothetical protein n=1 Tax=Roseibium algicola TaxID=2857014 RepID=UPI00345AD995